jgi:murein DD-endopeptidase MepM/ murein hydrolase activator NlpD
MHLILGSNQLKKIKFLYSNLPKQHKIILTSFSVLLLLVVLIPTEQASASKQLNETALEIGKRYQLALPDNSNVQQQTSSTEAEQSETEQSNLDAVEQLQQLQHSLSWQNATVRKGDSLAKILHKLGYSAQTTYQISTAQGSQIKQLTNLNVGDSLQLGTNSQNELIALVYPTSKTETLLVRLTDTGYQASNIIKTVDSRVAYAQGTISSNFWNAGLEAGLNDNQIINLANIFGWDIDFAQDLRKDDTFSIVYERNYIDGEFVGTGNILAAEIINQQQNYQAIRFDDGEYYTPTGDSMRKAFLRAPVNFKYISSSFKKNRFHPIQKRWKAHNGVDYRANTGTPVVAAGDGRVLQATYNQYNGNYVFIQHGNNIVTKYLHFSKRAVKKGQSIKQGQVIGYVGATGLAEAPHLHFEFLVNGVHRNPRTVQLPNAKPVATQQLATFTALVEQRLQQLAGARLPLLAMHRIDD